MDFITVKEDVKFIDVQ